MGLNTWWSIFRPEWTHGGIDSLTRGTVARLFDDFESYADNAAVQATWTETGGAGNPTLATVANAVRGEQSLQTVVAGSDGTIYRSIDNATFHYPAPGRIRYIAFKAVVTTGTATIGVRLSDASDANLFKDWTFGISTDQSLDYVIDLYSGDSGAIGGGGYLNTESYPGPTEGSTAWDENLIDRFTFTSLDDGSTFRFDDIRFFYEYSMLDAIGFGTEAPTDDGADGSVHSKLRFINDAVLQLVGSTEQYNKYGPSNIYLNYAYTFGLELLGSAGQGIPSTTEITPGNYTVDRVRDGTTTSIVGSSAASEAAGFISAAYTPLEDNWTVGDELVVTFSGGSVYDEIGSADTLAANAASGQAVITLTAPRAFDYQVGQQIRIYDDTPDTEYATISTIDSPSQITLSGNLTNTYATADNAAIILVEQTTLSSARLVASVTYEPEISRELQRWVLADYDDFDTADADGNNERWDSGYIADSDGGAAGTEGGSADINTTTAGQARVSVDPDATPTRAAYALTKDTPSHSKYYAVVVDANTTLDASQATSTFAGLRVSSGDGDDASNYVLVAREANSGANRIAAQAEFAGVVQTEANFTTTDNAIALKIERYENVWNIFYSLTQYPNWQWVKLTQFEDANGDMTATTTFHLYAESGGGADAQTAVVDFDNFKYYINAGALDQLLSTSVLGSGTFTTSSATVPADTGRAEANDFWNGTILMPITGAVAFQPRAIVDFANAGGVFTIDTDHPFTAAPAVGDEYVILVDQIQLIPSTDSTSNQTSAHVVGAKADTADYTYNATTSSLQRLVKGILGAEVIAEGTLTTSSATVPADTGRSEANNYWNGSWLMTVTGAVAFQPRLVVDFANAGGVFTLDADQPFTAAPGTVAYVILSPNNQLVPAADSTNNQTPAHVVGNKSDAASVTAGDASIIGRLRGLEAALSVNAAAGGEFEIDGTPDLWDALVNDSSSDASITTTTGDRDGAVIERLAALVNALQITDAGIATGFEEDGTGGTVWESIVAVKGTFTTSSATVPADTGRGEANDYFNGDVIVPLTGSAAGQARVIVDFANAGGVFTIDAEQPFTAATGTVTYIILHNATALVPAADSANNQTTAHVIGNKTDTIPAMNAAPASDSIVRQLKAILERVGATPADPDDSVLTNLGQRDDAATNDNMSDITTTSIEAKLRLILNRMSTDAFSATVQGGAQIDLDDMLAQLATYFSAAGAAWSVTANPGGGARTNLEQTLEDFADMLAGTTGVVTYPAAAVAGNGVSMAEVLRHAAEAIGENTANNTFDSSTVAANRDGSVLERLEDLLTEVEDITEVQEIVLYPVAIHQTTAELTDDGTSPAYAADTVQTTANAEGTPGVSWSETIDFEQEGTITVISIYAEFEWQTRFVNNAGAGTNTISKIQITGDGGSTWVDLTDNYSHAGTSYAARIRAGVGRWLSTVTAGTTQLGFRLVHWTDDAGATDASDAQIRTNSYVRIAYRKS